MPVQDHFGNHEREGAGPSAKSRAPLVLIGFLIIAGALRGLPPWLIGGRFPPHWERSV